MPGGGAMGQNLEHPRFSFFFFLVENYLFLNNSYFFSRIMRKPTFCICENKDADQVAKLISAFVFAT